MKTLLIIVAAIIVIAGLIIGYAYSEFTYKPDYFDEIETVDISKINKQVDETENRIARELKENNSTQLSGEEILNIGLNHMAKRSSIDLNSVVKKTKGEMVNGKFKTEALVNVKALSEQEMSPKARKALNMFLELIPDAMLEEVYISFEGKPVNDNGVLRFSDDAVIKIGGFEQTISDMNDKSDMKIDLDLLHQMGLSDIVIHDNYLELKK